MATNSIPTTARPAEVTAAWHAYTEATSEWRRVSAELDVAEKARPDAERADRNAHATAIEDGKPDPGTPNVDAHTARVAALRRERDARGEVWNRTNTALMAAVHEHEQEWRDALADELAAAEQRYADALAQLEAAQTDIVHVHHTGYWLDDPTVTTARHGQGLRKYDSRLLTRRSAVTIDRWQPVDTPTERPIRVLHGGDASPAA